MYQLSRIGHFVDQETWNFYSASNGYNDRGDRNPRFETDAAKESARTPHAMSMLRTLRYAFGLGLSRLKANLALRTSECAPR
jgi:hypothetical protein